MNWKQVPAVQVSRDPAFLHIVRQVDTPAASRIGGTMGAEQQIMGYRGGTNFSRGAGELLFPSRWSNSEFIVLWRHHSGPASQSLHRTVGPSRMQMYFVYVDRYIFSLHDYVLLSQFEILHFDWADIGVYLNPGSSSSKFLQQRLNFRGSHR